MNPLVELDSLVRMFPDDPPLIANAEYIPASLTPEPYKAMLVHEHHMTVTMESYHHSPVDVRILDKSGTGENYARKILLLKSGTDEVVQFGIVRFNLTYVTEEVRNDIEAGEIPLGRVLINHNVLRHIDFGAILKILPGPKLQTYFRCGPETVTYGRLATIFCNQKPAVDLLEITAPLTMDSPPTGSPQ